MKVTHFWKNNFIAREGDGSFILTNNNGSFACFSPDSGSKYNGFFLSKNDGIFKVIDSIEIPGKITELGNNVYSIVRSREKLVERFFLPHHYSSLCYELSENSEIDLFLDCRKANDFRQFGRYYNIYKAGNTIVVEFTKRTDQREDSSHDIKEFKLFIAIRSNASFSKVEKWVKRDYGLDRARNSLSERYVYHALRLNAGRVVFAVAMDEFSAVSEAEFLYHNLEKLQHSQKSYLEHFTTESIDEAAAETSLYSLVAGRGIYAGLPWFFQHWSRDSLISAVGLDRTLRKKMILSYLRGIGNDGRISPLPKKAHEGSSDAVGWLFLRARQLYLEKGFSASEIKEITAALTNSLELQQKNFGRNGLIYSAKNETWMDTSCNDNGREGFPVEVQALALAAYEFLWLLTKNSKAKQQLNEMKRAVRESFWTGSHLKDLANDATIRPNIFIAYYAYPQLLATKEWELCFDSALKALWLDWGGLSTIDKQHPLFQANYTGEDNRSYHRGDSWYWINNLAAIAMAKVNKKKYGAYIERIKNASINDLLWKGAAGCCSELSSASQQNAAGCLSQAWSAATLIEMLRETKQN